MCVESYGLIFTLKQQFVCLRGGNCRQELVRTLNYLLTASLAPPVTEDFKEVRGHVVQTVRNSAEEAVTHMMCVSSGRANSFLHILRDILYFIHRKQSQNSLYIGIGLTFC